MSFVYFHCCTNTTVYPFCLGQHLGCFWAWFMNKAIKMYVVYIQEFLEVTYLCMGCLHMDIFSLF